MDVGAGDYVEGGNKPHGHPEEEQRGLECVRSRNPTDTAGAAMRGGRGGYHELRDGQGSNWQEVGVFYSKCGEKPFKGLHT